ncbi:MAG TPA: DUF4304 domain-containing protein [Nitrosomonas europaea]|uniref:DUF4304 domain-containing protein n=2 Tax=Nitrosomonas europaea TaxID=915 RepID=UPI002B85883D|nr:DUF4304 domain-containing protein [Nitrosomonas europaea]HRN82635.1 DUF4304 domain-containing protein [Nitrosomonas europaea]HRO57166.1 DUF4304 domain-containing protein [Nitrosomonas europaea]HUM74932.1 DUF4304 domain-containing protein [Nitrosomonas europaea]
MQKIISMLQKALKEDFHEYMLQLGFQPEHRRGDVFPYRRIRDGSNDLVEVQFDKYERPRFVLNFGSVPADGIIDAYGRFVPAKNVCIAQLVQHGRLHAFPYSIIWFKPNTLLGFRSDEVAVNKVISHFIFQAEQVERWFRAGISGPNLRIYSDQWNAPGVRKKSMQERGVWPPEDWTEEDEKALRM